MTRRTLDLVLSTGGLALAVLLLVIGLVLTDNANFAKDYVREQLLEQRISFKPVDQLTDEERKAECLVEHAGRPLSTGKQAECYANELIGLHLQTIPNANGKTYAELGDEQTSLRAKVAEAQRTNAADLAALQKQLADVTAARETVFKGETLRGLLLTSYGFSVFGVRAEQVSIVVYIVAALLAALSIAGFAHAAAVRRDAKAFASPRT